MLKITGPIIAGLVCLLGIQSFRAHLLRRELIMLAEGTAGQGENSAENATEDQGAPANGSGDVPPGNRAQRHDERAASGAANEATHTPDKTDAEGVPDADPGGTKSKEAAAKARLAKKTKEALTHARDALNLVDYPSAISALRKCLAENPDSQDAYRMLASTYRDLGQIQNELAVYKRWAKQCPDDAQAYYEQACAYQRLGMTEEALEALARFQRLTKGDLDAYAMSAEVYRGLNMMLDERTTLRRWGNKAPDSADAHRELGDHYARANNMPVAIDEYEAAVALTPDNAAARRDLAYAYQRVQRYEDAQAELRAAMNLQPESMEVRVHLAQAYEQGANLEAALETYYGIVSEAPDSPQANRARNAIPNLEDKLGISPATYP